MPLSLSLPTTSFLTLQDYLASSTHPSLPVYATSQRSVVRQSLKEHKRLSETAKSTHLNEVLASLVNYVPYLLALDAGLSGRTVCGDEVQVDLAKEVQVEWRPTLTSSVGGREPARVKLQSFEYEILFVISSLAATHYLIARNHLHSLYNTVTPTPEQKTSEVSAAVKHFTQASSIYASLLARANQLADNPPVPDIAWNTFEALSSICRAETTLAAVLKDDPYPSTVVQSRNQKDQDWMIKAPDMPKVRAHLFARLCIAAAEHAGKAISTLGRSRGVTKGLTNYADDLRRTARGKACRFLAIDAELSSKTGEAIAWLNAAQKELGFAPTTGEEAKSKVFSKFKKDWGERREDRKIDKGVDWGSDGGRFEEGRVVDMLLAKWTSMNNTVNVQPVPPWEPLISKLPSGREYDVPKPWTPPTLDEVTLARLRALPDLEAVPTNMGEDDSDDDVNEPGPPAGLVGAFPDEVARDGGYY